MVSRLVAKVGPATSQQKLQQKTKAATSKTTETFKQRFAQLRVLTMFSFNLFRLKPAAWALLLGRFVVDIGSYVMCQTTEVLDNSGSMGSKWRGCGRDEQDGIDGNTDCTWNTEEK